MALPQVKKDALAARIEGLSLNGKGWAAAARAAAFERLERFC